MKLNKLNIAVVALTVAVLAGCKNEDLSKQHYDNKLFISATNFTNKMLIKDDITSYEREITAGIAKPTDQLITVEFAIAPELFDHYRHAFYDEDANMLSEEFYSFDETKTGIQPGRVVSTPLTIKFVNVNQLDKDERYVLPVTIRSVQGIDVLPSARSVYYVFQGAALVNVVADITENRAWPDWKNASPVTNMSAFTLEALINGKAFKNQISTIMGIEDKFLVRVGDSGLASNQLQISAANRESLTAPALKLETGRWYHVAVTFYYGNVSVYLNGEERLKGSLSMSSVNFGIEHSDETEGKPRCFWIGYSYDDKRYFDGMISEVRIWNRALTDNDFNTRDHFYRVEPTAKGLVAYWKFDEGSGKTIKDQTSYGNDLTVENELKWVDVFLPENEK